MNSQLAIALHIMGFLASKRGEPLTSDTLADTYGTNPVVLRRVLSKLRRAGLVETRRGVGGGSVLARDPSTINLRQVYEAVTEASEILRRHPGDRPNRVASILAGYVNELYADAEQALLGTLEAVTIASMDQELRSRFYDENICADPSAQCP
ncbi:MAG: Rrf2 family transcriptional regulator [Myxococcota bacterium]